MEITFDVSVWQILQLFVLPVLLPLLVGLVTKTVTSSSLKAILLLGLSVVTSLLTELLAAQQTGQSYNLAMGLLLAFITFVTGVAIQYGLWKPTGVTAAVQAVGDPNASKYDNGKVIEDPDTRV